MRNNHTNLNGIIELKEEEGQLVGCAASPGRPSRRLPGQLKAPKIHLLQELFGIVSKPVGGRITEVFCTWRYNIHRELKTLRSLR